VFLTASYLRGRHFVAEYDHQALKPLFQKQLKGAIYERWLAIFQQFDIEIKYKLASKMCVPDALSRLSSFQEVFENYPHFPYVTEPVHDIKLPSGQTLFT